MDSDFISSYDLIMPAATIITGVLSRNCKGMYFTAAGVISAGLASFHLSHPSLSSLDGLSVRYVLSAWVFPIALQVIGAISNIGNGGYKEDKA